MEKYQLTDAQRALLEGMQVPFAVYQFVNERVVTLALSDGFCKLFGYTDRAQAYHDMDHDMYKDTHPDDVARIANAAFCFATQGGKFDVIYRTRNHASADPESAYTVVHAIGRHMYTKTGVRLAQVWYTDEGTFAHESTRAADLDVTQTMHDTLYEQSQLKGNQYDYLTGLPNMTYFFELAESGKEVILEKNGMPAVLYIDFSGMKFFNAKHGFVQGDQLLKSFAKILSGMFGNESCCRIGADHFAVITEEAQLEQKLHRIFSESETLADGQMPPVHVGIYPQRMGNVSVSVACDRAKLACAALHGSYVSCYGYYNAQLREEAMFKQYIIENIDTAIREKRIQVYYQPIIRTVNEKRCDEEALARWIDPVHGFMPPSSFIPVLEETGLIYKLDLYVLEQVLENMQTLKQEGHYIIPRSINLSRSDFDTCDIVEEIRKRVDEAGISRNRITIEITESVIGSNFDFMKEQVKRFRSLGFPVWMDDFGSGYSSLDVLQSIRFDMLKFDMNFMRKLDDGENGRIILTELMKMATAMGVDTVCEGVETEEHVRFLREIGCTKLQGFYYDKPSPFARVCEWYAANKENGPENPAETDYYDAISRVNLYDLSVLAKEGERSLRNTYDTLPMGIIEIDGKRTRFVRSNQSYRDFIKHFLGIDLSAAGTDFAEYEAAFMLNVAKTCGEKGMRLFYDEKMPDGSVVHSFARRIGINPVNGRIAVVIAVLSISDPDESTTYAELARALAADYYNIYVVDLDTDQYIEYTAQRSGEELTVERHGTDFFAAAHHDTMMRIYEQDRELFLARFSKENIVRELDEQGVFTATYRLIDNGKPMYVNMKITRMQSGGNRIILGVSVIDAYMKQQEHFADLQKERDAMVRIMALSDGYLNLITVDLDSGCYVEYSSSDDFDSLGAAKQGEDFFRQSAIDAAKYLYPEDQKRFISQFTEENVMREIREHGKFSIRYRLVINGEPKPVTLKAALFRENGEEKMVVGVRA